MPAPTVLPGRAFQQVDPRSNLLFHWRASDMALTNVDRSSTGVFSRASAGGEVKNTNDQLTGPPADGAPMWEWSTRESAMAMRLEGARTNSVIQSENLSTAAGWTLARLTSDVNSTIVAAPDGRFTADLLTASTVDNTHFLERSSTTGALEASRMLSLHARAGGSDRVRVRMGNSTDAADFISADFKLSSTSTGAYVTSTGSGGTVARNFIETLGDSWFRVGLAGNLGSTGPGAVFRRSDLLTSTGGASYAGTGESFYGWGMQIEDGIFETSYIPTVGSAVTRAANTLKFPIAWEPDYGYTLYGKIVCRMLANTGSGNNDRIFEIGNYPSAPTALYLASYFGSDDWIFVTRTTAGGVKDTRIGALTGDTGHVPSIGDTFEFRISVPQLGDITWGVSKNGGAEATQTHTPGAWDAAFSSLFFSIGMNGAGGNQGYASNIGWKIAPGSGRSLGYLRQAF